MKNLRYTFSLLLLLPWALLHLLWRSRRQPEYRQYWGERFGCYPVRKDSRPLIWIHAVSVGETRAAEPLIKVLRQGYPQHRILLTHMTPTGRATSQALFGESVDRVYLPYDYPFAVRHFLRHFQPQFGLIMETELWPNLIANCHTQNIPLLLVNARLSAKSARRYASFPKITQGALQGLTQIAAQTEADAERLRTLGATKVQVLGNIKFDIEPPAASVSLGQAWRHTIGLRPVLVCASTREGEETLILAAWLAHRRVHPNALLILVPRHPQRFKEVAAMARSMSFTTVCRSEALPSPDTEVWIGDSMGELFAYYAASDVAFVGGSLLNFGSQNLIEPCALGVPVLIGESTFNFAEAAAGALAAGAARQVKGAQALVANAIELLFNEDERLAMRRAGLAFATQHRGATQRTLALIEQCVNSH